MGTVVVGRFPDHESLLRLTSAIKGRGLSVERLRIISTDTPSDDLIGSGVQFFSGDAEPEAIGEGTGIITGFGGTGVPGLTESTPHVEFRREPSTAELLGELDIPDRRTGEFMNALERGESIAGYNAGKDVDQVKELFAGSGASQIEVF